MKKNSLLNVLGAIVLGLIIQTQFAWATNGTGVVTVTANGSCLGFTAAVGKGPDNWEVAEGGSYTMTITGVTECNGDAITVFVQNSNSGNFCFNAVGGNGTYVGDFTVPNPTCYTMPISYKCGADQPCDNSNTYNADGQSHNHKVHLRASYFDANCIKTGDDQNCSASCTISLGLTCKKPKCYGGDNGSINITETGGIGSVTYLWNDGVTTEDRTGLSAGVYTVTATDSTGCTATISRNIANLPQLIVSETHTDVSTPGGNDGSIDISVSGGSGVKRTYVWNDGPTTQDRSGLSAGTYTITAYDAHNCPASLQIEISELSGRSAFSGANANALQIYPNPAQSDFNIEVNTGAASDENYTLVIENILGQVIYSTESVTSYGMVQKTISFDQSVRDGLYTVHVIFGSKEFTRQLTIQHSK